MQSCDAIGQAGVDGHPAAQQPAASLDIPQSSMDQELGDVVVLWRLVAAPLVAPALTVPVPGHTRTCLESIIALPPLSSVPEIKLEILCLGPRGVT